MVGRIKEKALSGGWATTAPSLVAGSGSGSGEKNYVTNPSGADDVDGWVAVGDLTVERTEEASELPRENTTGTGIKITATGGTQSTADYVYFDFDLDDVDLNRMLKAKIDQKALATYANGQFDMYFALQSSRGTPLTGVTPADILAADGEFSPAFMTTGTAAISLVIRATEDMTEGDGVVISDVIVGPGVRGQGAVVGERYEDELSESDFNNATGLSGVFGTAELQRVGPSLFINFNAFLSGTGSDSGDFAWDLPSPFDVLTFPAGVYGALNFRNDSATNGDRFPQIGFFYSDGATAGRLFFRTSPSASNLIGTQIGSSGTDIDSIEGTALVAVNGWSGTLNTLQEDNLSATAAASDFSLTNAGNAELTINEMRVGDSVMLHGRIAFGSTVPSGGAIQINLPSRLNIDTNKMQFYCGWAIYEDSGTTNYNGHIVRNGATALEFLGDSSSSKWGAGVPVAHADADDIDFWCMFPVASYSNVQPSLVGFSTATAMQAGLVSRESSTTVDPSSSGDISAGQSVIKLHRVGNQVTMVWPSLAHSSATEVDTATGLIPEEYRPQTQGNFVYIVNAAQLLSVIVRTTGQLSFDYLDWAGSGFLRTSTAAGQAAWSLE